jgi:hypothetical protein
VGAYTRNIALSPPREKETEQSLQMMFDLGYVKPEEVPQIPRLAKSPAVIVYSPLRRIASDAGCGFVCLQADCGHAAK